MLEENKILTLNLQLNYTKKIFNNYDRIEYRIAEFIKFDDFKIQAKIFGGFLEKDDNRFSDIDIAFCDMNVMSEFIFSEEKKNTFRYHYVHLSKDEYENLIENFSIIRPSNIIYNLETRKTEIYNFKNLTVPFYNPFGKVCGTESKILRDYFKQEE